MYRKNKIPIFYGVDDNYVPCLSVSICSLILNSSKKIQYEINILYQNLSLDNRKLLISLETKNVKIHFIYLKDHFDNFKKSDILLKPDKADITIYYRLFIPDLFPQYERAIYFDADTIIKTDLYKLFNLNFHNNLIAAASDSFICTNSTGRNYTKNALDINPDRYINSGVLLFDLNKMRQKDFIRHFLYLLNKYHFNLMAPDQDYLNGIMFGLTFYLSHKWNTQVEKVVYKDPKIIHYNLFSKPWNYKNVPFADDFWYYAKKTKFYLFLKNNLLNYPQSKIEANKKSKQALIDNIRNFPITKFTFKKARQAGENIRL